MCPTIEQPTIKTDGKLAVSCILLQYHINNSLPPIESSFYITLTLAAETWIHGNQYYQPGVQVDVKYELQRDPEEPDDKNCVRVLSPLDQAIVGNVCRAYAAELAPIMDKNPGSKFFVIREGRPPSNIYRIRVSLIRED